MKTKWVLAFLFIMFLVSWTMVSATLPNDDGESAYATGMVWDSWEDIELILREYPTSESVYRTTLPSSVDLAHVFPMPRDQGSQGSCVAWAVAYALKSSQEQTARGWGLDTDAHLFSPSYVYNQLNRGHNSGITIISAMTLLVNEGVSTLASFPYIASDFTTQPTAAQRAEAAGFRVADNYAISGIDSIKRRLAEGDGVIIGLQVYPDFDRLNANNPIYDVVSGMSRGIHAVCLVGYDDEKAAFKLINSWGRGWGLNGYGWVSYELMTDKRVIHYDVTVGYVMDAFGDIFRSEYPFDFSISDGEATIIRYLGVGGDVVIPDTLGGFPVKGFRDDVFKYNSQITGMVIGNNVTAIGARAFINCTSLTSVTIPDSVIEIGEYAFQFCNSLTDVFIPTGVTAIGHQAFSNYALTSLSVAANNINYSSKDGVLFDKNKTTLLQYPQNKSDLTYTIPDSVIEIAENAFIGSQFLTHVVIPNTVTTIGRFAFAYNRALTTVVYDSNAAISDSMFIGCGALTDVVITNDVTDIGASAFSYCRSLTSIVIPGSIMSIGKEAFSFCTSLTYVIIPNSVTDIDEDAFHFFQWDYLEYFPLPNLTIFCFANSYAHDYAIGNTFPFELLDNRRHGDVDGNGSINAADVTILRRYIGFVDKAAFYKDNPNFNFANADVNGDGIINFADVALLRRYLAASDPVMPLADD